MKVTNKSKLLSIILVLVSVTLLFSSCGKQNEIDLAKREVFTDAVFVQKIEKIDIYTVGKAKMDSPNVIKYMKELNSLPSWLKDSCSRIVFVDRGISEEFGVQGGGGLIVAATRSNKIYVDINNFSANTITHEMFHCYDFSNKWISTNEEFQDIYLAERNIAKLYIGYQDNVMEYFAYSAEKYFAEPDVLKSTMPLTYNYFDNLVTTNNNKLV